MQRTPELQSCGRVDILSRSGLFGLELPNMAGRATVLRLLFKGTSLGVNTVRACAHAVQQAFSPSPPAGPPSPHRGTLTATKLGQ